jgi:hypothetical protein
MNEYMVGFLTFSFGKPVIHEFIHFIEKGTTTQLQAFSEEFRNLWNAPPAPNEYSTIEATSSSPSLNVDEVPSQAKDSIATAASQTIRRIVNISLCSLLRYSILNKSSLRVVQHCVN